MAVINGIQGALTIALMLFVGYMLAKIGWLDERTNGVFSKILMNVSIPGLMVSNLMENYDRDKLLNSGTGLLIAFGTILISLIAGTIISHIINVNKKRTGIFKIMFAFSNTMYIGLPVNLALFGEKGVPYVLLYYLANTSLFWTIGNYLIRRDTSGDISFFTKESMKKVFSIPLLTFFVTIPFILLDIKLPPFLMNTFKYMGNLSTPMSMLMIGTIIYSMGFKKIKFDRDMVFVMVGRFLVTPLLVVLSLRFFTVPNLMSKVFIIQSSMPVMAQTVVSARAYDGDYNYAASAVTVSTLLSLLFIPVYMYLIG